MENSTASEKQQEIDVTAAFLISFGVLMALGGLMPAFEYLVSREWNFIQITFPLGVFLTTCGFALKHRHRHGLMASMIICFVGLAWFPIGTIVCAILLRMLWKIRPTYCPKIEKFQPEQADAGKPPSSAA